MTDIMDIQRDLEARMADNGVAKFRREAVDAYQRGEATSSPGMRFIMKHVIGPTTEAIKAFMEAAGAGRAGRKHTAVRLVNGCDPQVLAFLTAKTVLDGFAHEQAFTATGRRLGAAVEIEERLAAFGKTNAAYLKRLMYDLRSRTGNEEHKRAVVVGVLREKGDEWAAWTQAEQALVGTKLIELLIEATGVAELVARRRNRRTTYTLQVTEAFRAWLVHLDAQFEMLQPEFMPCVVPPKPWPGLEGGAYHTDAFIAPPTLVKTRDADHLKLLRGADLSQVLRAVNAIQATGWAVEQRTLAVLREIVERQLDVPVIPPQEDLPIPPRPAGLPEVGAELTPSQEEELKAWKRTARETYTANEKLASKRFQVLKTLSLASEFAAYPAIYFPCQLDFRGRVYAVPQVLNPQGSDFAKGLLVFAEGRPLEDERALGWWMIHGANTFGVDKVGLDERIAWVQRHEADILASAQDPLGNRWWMDADSPFCFLTWCFEYADWWPDGQGAAGEGFSSRIPIALDGTCNGLQHYSAMLRDPVGGAAVNLLPAEKPQDIYGEVARVVDGKLRDQSEFWTGQSVKEGIWATDWTAFGIDRKITKRPVMVLPYGGTFSSCKDYVEQAVREQIAGGKPNPFGEDLKAACQWLAAIVWESIGEVVVAARAAMGWLMDTSRVAGHAGEALVWTAPSGFVVRQAYPTLRKRVVYTQIHGGVVQLDLREEVPGAVDKRRQANGVAPNFVHSMDASALVMTVNLALDNGVTQFAMIHDSYGTSAGHTDMLAACTRHAFVDQYQEHDVLTEFRASIASRVPEKDAGKLPQVPTAGGLDLQDVLSSAFFFA